MDFSRIPRLRRYTIIKRVRGKGGGHSKDIEVLQMSPFYFLSFLSRCTATPPARLAYPRSATANGPGRAGCTTEKRDLQLHLTGAERRSDSPRY
ncbi:hypothetical protein EVAR_56895_1 [Eumeta japonica]|uniref:Uncharacterized protein n=1 Tax=Eumeta variegata TaxID=151549 RepID=A0A4C1ZKW8_EUMVA|nr:hypothetical protein EVAR_56895_1 [Eumeta japonica]